VRQSYYTDPIAAAKEFEFNLAPLAGHEEHVRRVVRC
jgi:hypothetical protein